MLSEAETTPVVERLGKGDGQRLRAIRLRALRDEPDAFGSTFEDIEARSPESWDRDVVEIAAFIATKGGRDIGLVRGTRHDTCSDAGYLISLWVEPESRRSGVGSALVDAVVGWAQSHGLERLFLDVGERNGRAIGLYTRKGFEPNGVSATLPPPREHIREIQLVRRV